MFCNLACSNQVCICRVLQLNRQHFRGSQDRWLLNYATTIYAEFEGKFESGQPLKFLFLKNFLMN